MWLFSLYFENVTVSSRYCIYRHALDATRPSQENIWVMQTGPEQSPIGATRKTGGSNRGYKPPLLARA